MEERGLRPWRKITRNFSERAANAVEKLWLVKEMVLHGETAKDLSKLYGIGRKALKRWSKAYKDRGILHGNLGRPTFFPEEVKKDIIGAMTNNIHEKTSAEFEKIVQEAHKKDVMSHSSTPNCQINQISQRSIKRIQFELGIKDGNAEQTTNACERACADTINAISTAVAHHTMVPLTSPYLMYNADGTSFTDGVEGSALRTI